MGIQFCKKRKGHKAFRYEKFKNGELTFFNSKENFNLFYNKKKSYELYRDLQNVLNYDDKIKKFKEILSLNNYDENIIYDYLSLLKEYETKKSDNRALFNDNINNETIKINEDVENAQYNSYSEELEKYSICLSKEKYFDLEKKQKKSAKEYLKEFFEKIGSFDAKYEKRAEFAEYLTKKPKSYDLKINFTESENQELYLYFLYYTIFEIFKIEKQKYSQLILDSKATFNEKLHNYINPGSQIEKFSDFMKTDSTLILYTKFFDCLNQLSNFIKLKSNILVKIFEQDKIDFYILEGIILLMRNQIQYFIDNINYSKALDDYFDDTAVNLDINELNKKYYQIKISICDNNLRIFPKNENNSETFVEIENYKMYNNLDIILQDIDYCFFSTNSFNVKYYISDHIKLKYFQENNYVKYSLPFINNFHENISKSETIISLVNYLYPGYEEEGFLSKNFIHSIFEGTLKNAKFYPFKTKIYSTTFYHSLNINYQIFNQTKEEERKSNLYNTNFFKYIILNLGYFILCEYHENLGHYLREYLKLLTKINYESPRDNKDNKESGTYIQYLLLDNKTEFNLIELLYILDYDNYNVDYEIFNKNFINIDLENYEPSSTFKNELKIYFGIEYESVKNIIKQDIENKVTYNLFSNFKSKNIDNLPTIKFEINKPCSLNLNDAYLEDKKYEEINKKINEELKHNLNLYLLKKN